MPSKASVHLTIKDCEPEGERGQMTQMTKEEMAAHLAAVPANQEERFVCVDTQDLVHTIDYRLQVLKSGSVVQVQ